MVQNFIVLQMELLLWKKLFQRVEKTVTSQFTSAAPSTNGHCTCTDGNWRLVHRWQKSLDSSQFQRATVRETYPGYHMWCKWSCQGSHFKTVHEERKYTKFTPEQQPEVAKYTVMNGLHAIIFLKEFGTDLKESTIRMWKTKFLAKSTWWCLSN